MIGFYSAGAMGSGTPSAWTPAHLSPAIWADDSSSVTDVSGNASQWDDKSGNGYHFTAGSGRRPQILPSVLNGRRVLRFNGVQNSTGSKMTGAAGTESLLNDVSAAWCFAVLNKRNTDAVTTYRALLSVLGSDANWRFGAWIGDSGFLNKPTLTVRRLNADAVVSGRGATILSGGWHSVFWAQNYGAAMGNIRVDGASEFSGALGTSGNTQASDGSMGLILGGNAGDTMCADIDLACFLFGAGSVPSGSDINNLFAWAADRYGL